MTNNKPNWIKTEDDKNSLVWRFKNTELTIAAYNLEYLTKNKRDKNRWFVGGAVQGRGIAKIPKIVDGKKEAISLIAKLKVAYKEQGIEAFD